MTAGDADALARASWALALCTEVYRVGGVLPGSPLALLLQQREFTADALLSLASEGAMRQLRDLRKVAEERLLPSILPATRLDLGPTFDGSALCPADADLIHDGRLLDIKTHLGALNKRTGRGRTACRSPTCTRSWRTHCSIGRTFTPSGRWASTRPATGRL